MANYQPVQTNFTSGEVSPYFYARTDLKQYANSARTLQNLIVRPQGGLLKRSGTIYVTPVADQTNGAQLIPFVYATTDTYIIEMGAGYFRFYRDSVPVTSSTVFSNGSLTTNITGWTTNNSGTGSAAYNTANRGSAALAGGSSGVGAIYQALTYIGTSTYTVTCNVYTNTVTYTVGTTVGGSDVATGTLTAGTGKTFTFTPTTEGTVYVQFSNAANNTAYVNTISINAPIYQITNNFSIAEFPNVRWAQSYDTLYLFHQNHPPQIMQRFGDSSWIRSNITFLDGPYFDITDLSYGGIGTGITISMSGKTGSVTATASAALFLSTDVGRLIRYRSVDTAEWWWGVITAYTSATSVTVAVSTQNPDNGFDASGVASTQWRLGYFSNTTGFPGVGTIYQQRFTLAALTTKQQTIFFSNTADLYNMQPDDSSYQDNQIDSSGMVYTIADNEGNVISGFSTLNWFFAYTSGGIWVIDSTTNPGGALTPSTIYIKKVINEASANIPPAVCRTSVVYSHIYGRKLLEIGYNWATNLYVPTDLATLAEQRTVEQIQWTVVQTSPNYIVWNMMGDGSLSACTYYKEQQITAWHEHILGGTDAAVKAMAVIPGVVEDQLWLIVSRVINGSTKYYIEYLSPSFLLDSQATDSIFLDCCAEYTGTSTSTITGLGYLEGQTVSVFGNGGVVVTNGPVTSGTITLQTAVTQAWVGLPYTSVLQTNVPITEERGTGSSHGRISRIYEADLQFYNSYGGQIGSDANNLDLIQEYTTDTVMGNPISLQSGVFNYVLPTDYGRDQTLYIQHTLPTPFFLTGIVFRVSPANAV